MWKRLAVLVVVALLPISAVAHTKLFYRMSYRSEYRKVEVTITPIPEPMVTAKPTEIPLVEIPLESTVTPEFTELITPTLTPNPSETPTEVPTPTPEEAELPGQISTPSDVDTQTIPPAELL